MLLVGAHHLVVALTMPDMLFSSPQAREPTRYLFVLLHAAFVIAMCLTQLSYWRFAAHRRGRGDAERDRLAAENQAALRAAARRRDPA